MLSSCVLCVALRRLWNLTLIFPFPFVSVRVHHSLSGLALGDSQNPRDCVRSSLNFAVRRWLMGQWRTSGVEGGTCMSGRLFRIFCCFVPYNSEIKLHFLVKTQLRRLKKHCVFNTKFKS